MPLNLLKVQKLMYSAGFIIDTFFVLGRRCRYMKALSLVTGDNIVIYISSGYDFFIDESAGNVFNIKIIDFETGDNLPEKYGDYPDKKELGERYGQNLKLTEEMDEDDLEADMENNYKKRIDLKSMERESILIIKDCVRQLKRLSLSMQGIRYKLCIIKDKYLCLVNDDIIDFYFVKNHSTGDKRLFYIVCDLEYFYEKMPNINDDMQTIKTSIYKLLDKNGATNAETMVKISKKILNTNSLDKEINRIKAEYNQQIQRYTTRLEEYSKQEQKLQTELSGLDGTGGFFNDTAYINKKASIDGQLNDIDSERQKILKIVIQLRQKCDNIYLNYDKIEFDNCILVNGVAKNFTDLDMLIKLK